MLSFASHVSHQKQLANCTQDARELLWDTVFHWGCQIILNFLRISNALTLYPIVLFRAANNA